MLTNLELSRIILISKRKEQRNDTDNNKNPNRATHEAQGVGKEKRINS
uniref:Uncharacterized protein n=1 Tax=Myoviridae sp. ctNQr16 TaxID=2826644 RepID=A0A8S5MAH9_9CAUD|nr:MAG TPA: hypothetical protein [Myoviridae sp. ctNQr16]